MIGLYDRYVFKATSFRMGIRSIEFIEVWNKSHNEFLDHYHALFPNEQLHIYKHQKRAMSHSFRISIEDWMLKTPWFVNIKRDETIDKLLS